MEKTMKPTKWSPILFALLGLALVFVAYLLAGGQDRLMPFYGFPEPAYGCNFDDIGVLSSEPAPDLSRGYRQEELLKCYPQQDYPLYALAVFGVIMSACALIIRGLRIFQLRRSGKENCSDGIGAFLISVLILLIGGWILKLELDFVGGGHPEPPDIFNGVALALVLMSLLVALFGVVSILVGAIKTIRDRTS